MLKEEQDLILSKKNANSEACTIHITTEGDEDTEDSGKVVAFLQTLSSTQSL